MPPKLIISRPTSTAQGFAQDVQTQLGRDVSCIFSPAYEIAFLPLKVDPNADVLIFTSANGVAAAVRAGYSGQQVWCVGDRTAAIAQSAGFVAQSAGGDVEDLLRALIAEKPKGRFLHVAGEHTRVDLAQRLTAHGVVCDVVKAYSQDILPPSPECAKAFKGSDRLVIPLFSPRAVFIVAGSELKAPAHIVAMSQTIGDAAAELGADTVVIAKAPTYIDMVDQTCRVLARLFDRSG